MNKKIQRFLFASLLTMVLIVLIFIGKIYLPYGNIFRHSHAQTESSVSNGQSFNSPNSLAYNFEPDPKLPIPSGLFIGIAHSGQFSAKVFSKNSYSPSIERKVSEIGIDNLNEVAISSWVYIFPTSAEVSSYLVMAISNDLGMNVVLKRVRVDGNALPMGKWFKVSGLFDLSDIKIKPDYKIQVYFWNNSFTDILVDDFYIVFGGPKARRGDSTLVNLTGGASFTPKFNFPPYPFHLLEKEEINNQNSSFLINDGVIKDGDLSPYDRIFSGHFISDNHGTEDLLVINKAGKAKLFTFCRNTKTFYQITLKIAPSLLEFFQSADILTGYFTGVGISQILLSGRGGLLLGEFEQPVSICSGKVVETSFKSLLNTTNNPFQTGSGHIIAADLDGKKITEILSTTDDGSWKVYSFEKGNKNPWVIIASGQTDPLKQWNTRKYDFKITSGRFLQKYSQDIVLTISGEKSKKGFLWSLLRFDPVSRSFIPCFTEKQNYHGKTIGLDTLKPSDEFLSGNFDNSGKVRVFRYNRDWRYDLKEIRFNDSTFQIIANMDFSGYEKDFNPKYYEILRLFPAMLIDPGLTSLLVIGKNCKNRDPEAYECKEFVDIPSLPGMIGVYSLKKTKK
jgi:hypothetical protein